MSLRVGLIFAAVAVLWGVPFALIEVALDHGAEPLLIAWTRVAIGAAVLLGLAAAQRKLRGLRPYAGALVVIAIADVALPFTLVSFAQEHVSSSLAGILIASTPLFVGALAGAIDQRERPSRRGWAGLVLGFAGVVALLGLQLSGELTAAAMLLLAAIGYAVATLLVRRLDDSLTPLAVSALALGIATVLLAPGAAVSLPTGATGRAWAALAALGVLCTGAAFALYYLLIAHVGATRAALSVYLAPIVSVFTGAIALGEALTAGVLAGLVLILTGSWLAR
jgi:drug/metabolite transporter (DMT)-like permease